jgi:hypothetical protein
MGLQAHRTSVDDGDASVFEDTTQRKKQIIEGDQNSGGARQKERSF